MVSFRYGGEVRAAVVELPQLRGGLVLRTCVRNVFMLGRSDKSEVSRRVLQWCEFSG